MFLIPVNGAAYDGRMVKKDCMLQVRCTERFLADLDEWRATLRPIPSRSEAIRRAAMRGAALDRFLPVILRESARELVNAGVVCATTEPETYVRWSRVLIQSLDHAAAEGGAPDQAQETLAPDTAAPRRRQEIR